MLISIDSNIFISALGSNQHNHALASKLMLDIKKGKHQAITSSITYGEVLGASSTDKSELDLSALFSELNIKTIPADDIICKLAGSFRTKNEVKLPDAIHSATAYINKASVFISNDKRLINSINNHVKCITLEQWGSR